MHPVIDNYLKDSDMEYWYYNPFWKRGGVCGLVDSEEEAVRLASKDHLIIFMEDPLVMIETSNY